MNSNNIISVNLKKEMLKQNFSIQKLSEKANVSYKTLCNILNGKVKNIRLNTILKIIKVLKISLKALVGC